MKNAFSILILVGSGWMFSYIFALEWAQSSLKSHLAIGLLDFL